MNFKREINASQLTLTPYYDDFTESKKFIEFFIDSFAVQARELTQSQTILQNQIERLSDTSLNKGAMVILVKSVTI